MENSKTSLSELISLERPNWQHQPKNALSAANAVTTLKQVHEIVNGPARLLSLDLEFYCDGQPQMPGTTRLGQIAGRVYGQNDAFNYYVFSSKMTPKDQLSLLKRLDLRYSEAERLTVASVLKKVLRFIDRVQQPTTWSAGTIAWILACSIKRPIACSWRKPVVLGPEFSHWI